MSEPQFAKPAAQVEAALGTKPNTSPETHDYSYASDPFYFAAATIAAKRDLGLLPPKHVR